MYRALLFVIPMIVLSGAVWADAAVQTDWVGGSGVWGPVPDWGNHFYLATDLDWDTTPGQLKLIIETGENVIDSSVDYAFGCVLSDMDLDGDLDMVSCSYNGGYVSWWENSNGGETWVEHSIGSATGPVCVQVADLDGDGDKDVIASLAGSDEIKWWTNVNQGSTWVPHQLEASFDARQIVSDDFDGDGDPDLLGVSSSTGDVVWWQNRLAQSLPWLKTYIDGSLIGAYSCDSGDFDGDGDFDVIASTLSGDDLVMYINDLQYTGSWIKSTIDSDVIDPYSVIFANVDGDPRNELICASSEGLYFYDYHDTMSSWTTHAVDPEIHSVTSVVSVDMDGDGDTDLASCSGGSYNDVFWYQNLPQEYYWVRTPVDLDFQGGNCIVAGDISGEGVPDIAASAGSEDRLSWWRIGGYTTPGMMYSSILQIAQPGYWQYLYFSYDQPYGTSVFINLRASDNPYGMGNWSADLTSPGSIIGLLEDGLTYLQYKATLVTTYPYATPSLKDITVIWSPTGIEEGGDLVLSLASPNPCFGSVDLAWTLPEAGNAELTLFDAAGRVVRVLENGWHEAGQYTVVIEDLPSGVYAACLQGSGFTALQRIVILD